MHTTIKLILNSINVSDHLRPFILTNVHMIGCLGRLALISGTLSNYLTTGSLLLAQPCNGWDMVGKYLISQRWSMGGIPPMAKTGIIHCPYVGQNDQHPCSQLIFCNSCLANVGSLSEIRLCLCQKKVVGPTCCWANWTNVG